MSFNTGFFIQQSSSVPLVPYSMSFDGVNEYIKFYNDAAYDFAITDSFTGTSWVKSANYAAAAFQGILSKRDASYKGYVFFIGSGQLQLALMNSLGNFIYVTTSGLSLTNNTWYHVAFTYNGNSDQSGVKFFVNGVEVVGRAVLRNDFVGTMNNSQPLSISYDPAEIMYFNGKIGYTRLFNTEFTAAQVLADYNVGVMLETSLNFANQVMGWKSGQGALFATEIGTEFFFPNELDPLQISPFTVNMEFTDRTTDVP